jgi:hypothetical protein
MIMILTFEQEEKGYRAYDTVRFCLLLQDLKRKGSEILGK